MFKKLTFAQVPGHWVPGNLGLKNAPGHRVPGSERVNTKTDNTVNLCGRLKYLFTCNVKDEVQGI